MRMITYAYRLANGNKSRAAEMLGISRFALQRKLEKYDIRDEAAPAIQTAEQDEHAAVIESARQGASQSVPQPDPESKPDTPTGSS